MIENTLLKTMTVSVVMPVYNEKTYIWTVIKRVVDTGIPDELVVVDDFSTDGTRELLAAISMGEYPDADYMKDKRCAIKVFFHDKNRGKGAGLRTGFEKAGSDIVIVQDADLEYDPRDYSKLLAPILEGKADVVYGSRFMGDSHRVLFFWHMIGNKTLTLFSNILTNLNLTDMETGYKAFRSDVLKRITIVSNRFGFEPEVTAKAARLRCRMYEVGISYFGRTYAEGKKITWVDGIKAIFSIFRFWISH